MEELKQRSLFEPVRVADFILEKDRLFAEVVLSADEMKLYDKVYEHLTLDSPTPDLVIYLQAPVEVLMGRKLSVKTRMRIQSIGMFILLSLMAFLLINDIDHMGGNREHFDAKIVENAVQYMKTWPTPFTALYLADRKSSWGVWDYRRSNHDVQCI